MSLTMTDVDHALKTLYPDGVAIEVLKESALLAMMAKDNEFTGRNRVIDVVYAGNRNRSAAFAKAQTAGNSNPGFKGKAFTITRASNYAYVTIDRQTMKAAKKDKGALVDALSTETRSAITTFRQDLSSDLYGSGTGKRGQIATGGITTNTITLTDANDTVHFEVGDILELSATNGGGAGVRAGTVTLTGVDRDAGVLTCSANVTTGIAAAGDYIFKQGDYDSKAKGLAGWIPFTAPTTGDNWWGVDRSADAVRLAGMRFDGSTMNHEQALQKAGARFARHGAKPKFISMHPDDVATLELILGSKKTYEDVEAAGLGFTSVTVNMPYGKANVFGDMWCPKGFAYALSLESWTLYSLDEVPHWVDDDGDRMLRQASADGFEMRLAGYYQFGCDEPGANGVIKLAP